MVARFVTAYVLVGAKRGSQRIQLGVGGERRLPILRRAVQRGVANGAGVWQSLSGCVSRFGRGR